MQHSSPQFTIPIKLVSALAKVISGRSHGDLFALTLSEPGHSWGDTEDGRTFLRTLSSAPQLELFDEYRLHQLGAFRFPVERDSALACWMARRAYVVGAERAVSEVYRYATTPSFIAHEILLIANLSVHEVFTLGNGIELRPIQALQSEYLRGWLNDTSWSPVGGRVNCALIRTFAHKTQVVSQSEPGSVEPFQIFQRFQQEMMDAYLCLTLSRSSGLGCQPLARTIVPDDSVPLNREVGWSLCSYRGLGSPEPPLIDVEVESASRLFGAFNRLTPSQQSRLRIPMQKLNESVAEGFRVQSGIDLRTALESLFLDAGNDGEFSHRLSVRGAMFNGVTLEDRRSIQRMLKSVYTLCSAAVHSGQFPKKPKNALDLLCQAVNLMRQTLVRIICEEHGIPDWTALELTGGGDKIADPTSHVRS